jgi:molybdate transport system ATP-binding protein
LCINYYHLINMPGHIAIYITDTTAKEKLLQQLQANSFPVALKFLNGLNGFVFTSGTLLDFIKEEIRHELYFVKPVNGISLATSSEGEQKKAMLYHLLKQAPGYLVIDEIFDNLDIATQREVTDALAQAAAHTLIVQLFGRRQDLLSFIHEVLVLENNQLVSIDKNSLPQAVISNSDEVFIPAAAESKTVLEDPLIKMIGINISYNEHCILKNINWQINKGEYWQLKGPNGSGKTTLLSMINGDNTKAYKQNITLFGYKKGTGETVWDIKKHIGYFSQAIIRFFDRYDSAENMIAGGMADTIGLYQKPSDRVMQLANEWLKVLGLQYQNKKLFVNFSQGHQRMILIARAMIKHPPLLILDEPTAGLNDADAVLIVSLINKIAAETNTAVIFVSHRSEPGLQPDFVFELLIFLDVTARL